MTDKQLLWTIKRGSRLKRKGNPTNIAIPTSRKSSYYRQRGNLRTLPFRPAENRLTTGKGEPYEHCHSDQQKIVLLQAKGKPTNIAIPTSRKSSYYRPTESFNLISHHNLFFGIYTTRTACPVETLRITWLTINSELNV